MSMPMHRKRYEQGKEKTPLTVTAKHHVRTWQEFLAEAKKMGLQVGYYNDYGGEGLRKDEKHILEEVILFDKARGIIVYAYTFSGRSVNYAKLYGELKYRSKNLSDEEKGVLTHFNHLQKSKDAIAFAMDVRTGIQMHIEQIEKYFKFHSPWTVVQEFQFVNTVEKDEASAEKRREITEGKLKKVAPSMRDILIA